jgi:hypothetical protein
LRGFLQAKAGLSPPGAAKPAHDHAGHDGHGHEHEHGPGKVAKMGLGVGMEMAWHEGHGHGGGQAVAKGGQAAKDPGPGIAALLATDQAYTVDEGLTAIPLTPCSFIWRIPEGTASGSVE